MSPQLDEAGATIGVSAIERTLAACLDGIRRVQTQRGAPATRKSATRLLSRRFLRRSLLVASEKISPTVVKSLDGCMCGKVQTSRSIGSEVSALE